ncbi:MAG: alpha-amylase [Burkholderiales bacterium]|nr:alpha-amylase [Burkholderiales bacterium]
MRPTAALPACALALALAACGGGGGGGGGGAAADALPAVDVSTVAAADPGSALPAGWQHGAFMEVFVRSYQDSDGNGSGDLRGLISRLDYLRDLGVRGLWLMPVTASQDHDHGYAVADYRAVEPAYGSLADLDALLAAAHARGIGVILDYVMNHSAASNPLFVNSAASASSPWRNWYVWRATDPGGWSVFGADPWHSAVSAAGGVYFGAFSAQMPDWNLLEPAVVAYHHDNLRFWLNRGVDGFRFDAVGNLVENGPAAWLDQPQDYALMADVRTLLAGYAGRFMVCEAPDDPQGFGAASACGGAFAFDLRTAFVRAAQGDAAGVAAIAAYPASAPAGMAPFIANHDAFAGARLWNQLYGSATTAPDHGAAYKLAAAGYLLLPGTPFLYYGEEIGMADTAGPGGDAAQRSPMSWTADPLAAGFSTVAPYRALAANAATQNVAAQQADPRSILAFYKALLALRNGRVSIAAGTWEWPFASGRVLGFQRAAPVAGGIERTLVLVNYGPATIVPVPGLAPAATLTALLSAALSDTAAAGAAQPCQPQPPGNAAPAVALAAQAVCVFAVGP